MLRRRRPQGHRRRPPLRPRVIPRRQDHPRRPPQGQEPLAPPRLPALPHLPVRSVAIKIPHSLNFVLVLIPSPDVLGMTGAIYIKGVAVTKYKRYSVCSF